MKNIIIFARAYIITIWLGLNKRLTNDGHGHLLLIKNNGTVEKILCGYVKEMFIEYDKDIINIMDTIKEEFSMSLSKKFLEEFNENNIKTIEGNIKSIEKKIKDIIGHELSETTKASLMNICQNAKSDSIHNLLKKNESMKRLLEKDSFLSCVKKYYIRKFN